jgi:hypothetical protein
MKSLEIPTEFTTASGETDRRGGLHAIGSRRQRLIRMVNFGDYRGSTRTARAEFVNFGDVRA